MLHVIIISLSLLVSLQIISNEPPFGASKQQEKLKREIARQVQFHTNAMKILADELPRKQYGNSSYKLVRDNGSHKYYEIFLGKKTPMRPEHKNLILHQLHQLQGGVFDFGK